MNDAAVIGVLLAAGRGTRMGRVKQLVPVPAAKSQLPLVAAAFDSIAAFTDRMLVVVGFQRASVIEALGTRRFQVVESSADVDMAESFRAAMRQLGGDSQNHPREDVKILLQLGDHPRAAAITLQQLLETSRQHPRRAILPRFQGRGGHPILIPGGIAKMLVNRPLAGGLKVFWQANPDRWTSIEVDDPGVTMNLNTPDDLRRL
ncbi:MAG: NTP transferase domain-containing protein [Planctomycetota bacterium]